jgi:hypothetical protein
MFRTALGLVSAAVIGLAASQAHADAWFYYGPRAGYSCRHGGVHAELDHRAYHRELEHRAAHRFPMTYGEHEALHDALDHDAYHDAVDHSRWHRYNRYYGGGVYFGGGRSRIIVRW